MLLQKFCSEILRARFCAKKLTFWLPVRDSPTPSSNLPRCQNFEVLCGTFIQSTLSISKVKFGPPEKSSLSATSRNTKYLQQLIKAFKKNLYLEMLSIW